VRHPFGLHVLLESRSSYTSEAKKRKCDALAARPMSHYSADGLGAGGTPQHFDLPSTSLLETVSLCCVFRAIPTSYLVLQPHLPTPSHITPLLWSGVVIVNGGV
jgi:hypothetical protein